MVVFQDHAVFPWYTAQGNVAYGLLRQGVARREARVRAAEALVRMGLSDFLHAYPASLSGGMCQRVALARALVSQTDTLLLDEPFAALDTITRTRLQDDLLTLWEEYNWTIVFVTHNLAEAVYLADRVIVLDHSPVGLRGIESLELPRPRSRRDPSLLERVEHLDAWMRQNNNNTKERTGLCPGAEYSLGK
jgi:NitT/TauT family transport system ATP-binding protein